MVDEYVAVDVETTGLSPERDRLLEIGAVLVATFSPGSLVPRTEKSQRPGGR